MVLSGDELRPGVRLSESESGPVGSADQPAGAFGSRRAETGTSRATPVAAVTPSGQEVEIAEVIATEQVVPSWTPASKALPQTGSMLPLTAVLGILCLAAGFGLCAAPKKA